MIDISQRKMNCLFCPKEGECLFALRGGNEISPLKYLDLCQVLGYKVTPNQCLSSLAEAPAAKSGTFSTLQELSRIHPPPSYLRQPSSIQPEITRQDPGQQMAIGTGYGSCRLSPGSYSFRHWLIISSNGAMTKRFRQGQVSLRGP